MLYPPCNSKIFNPFHSYVEGSAVTTPILYIICEMPCDAPAIAHTSPQIDLA